MPKKLIRFNSSLPTVNMATKNMFVGRVNGEDLRADYYVIENVSHMIRNGVMNGLLYSDKVFDPLAQRLMNTNARIPAPLSHPSDEKGNFVDANDPITFPSHNIGAFDADWRVNGDKLVSNTYIPVDSIANASEANKWFADRVTNKLPIDRSTGLYLNVDDSVKGYGSDGEPYYANVSEIYELNHSAILNPDVEPGAKNNGEGVGMFCNSSGDKMEIIESELTTNASTPAMNLPLAPDTHVWSESAATGRIKEYTDSVDAPSSNYRKFFLEFDQDNADSFSAYKYPFADIIDGVPHAIKNPLMSMADTDEYAATYMKRFDDSRGEDASMFNKFIKACKSLFSANELSHDDIRERIYQKINEGTQQDEYRCPVEIFDTHFIYRDSNDKLYQQGYSLTDEVLYLQDEPRQVERVTEYKPVFNNNGDRIMRDKILAALTAANVKTDGLDDDALFAAYNELNAPSGDDSSTANGLTIKDVTEAVANAVKPLQDQINANADKELNDAVDAVVAMNKGINEEAAKAMGLAACNAFLAANGHVAVNARGNHQSQESEAYSSDMPE